ncbi:BBE domain-containing protein [Paraburkholderia sp. RL17-337-BIB-A]|uniref:BBE domain-containing protein n=1 Tax=Paraburkholderia sp. RL17-337-BIB-A TaxID=3031636 RepID=UPI0038BB5046
MGISMLYQGMKRDEAAHVWQPFGVTGPAAIVSNVGTYLSGCNFFEGDWQQANWGSIYARVAAAKRKYDPDGLCFVHRGVNSAMWSTDGFTRVKSADD